MERNKINFITGETYTLAELFSGNRRIVIPDLQRDYCWGNETNKKASGEEGELVSDFLNNLIEQFELKASDELNLGLFYGYEVPANHIQLCDGQQRLTTLYLLLGMLNKMTGKFRCHLISDYEYVHDDKEPYLNYAIRESSLYFLSDLVCKFFIDCDEEVESIRRSEWFFNEYSLDPSINSMLNALNIIEKIVSGKDEQWLVAFGDWLLNKLTFLYFDMENRRNGEETFVVINTTGEPLSATQNLKPLIIAADINKGVQGIDYGWENIETWFWKNKCQDNGNDTADAGFTEFLRWVWMIEKRDEKVDARNGKIEDLDEDGNRIAYEIQLILKGTSRKVFPYKEISYKTVEAYWQALKWIISQNDLFKFGVKMLSPAANREVNKRKAIGQNECFVLLPLLSFVYRNISTIESDVTVQRNAKRLYEFFAALKNVPNVSKAVNVLVRETLTIVDQLVDNDILSLLEMSGVSSTIRDEEELWKMRILRSNPKEREEIEETFWDLQRHEIWNGKILTMLKWASDEEGYFDFPKFKNYINIFHKLFEDANHSKVITTLRRSMIALHSDYQPLKRSHYSSFGWDWSQWTELLCRESDKTKELFDYILERFDESKDLSIILESYIAENLTDKQFSEFAESDYLMSFMINSSADIKFDENDWQIAMNGEIRHGIFLSRRNAYILREFGGDYASAITNPHDINGTDWRVSHKGGDAASNCLIFTHTQSTVCLEVAYKTIKEDSSGKLEIKSQSEKLALLGDTTKDEKQRICLTYEVDQFDSRKIKDLILGVLTRLSEC